MLPVAPSPAAFHVSVGPGPTGSPWLVWTRCSDLNGCDVVRYDLDDPGERPIAAAALAGVSESAPSIWRSRIVLARRTTTGAGFASTTFDDRGRAW